MKTLLKLLASLCAVASLASPTASEAQANVLLIIADDLGLESLAAFNGAPSASLPPTPTIDSIQSQGVTFTRFYAYPTCSPTRGSMMTGRYGFRTGVTSPMAGSNVLQPNEYTLPEALVDSGAISNRLACIGKWHLGGDDSAPNTIGGWPFYSGSLGGAVGDYYSWAKTVNGVTTQNYTEYATTDKVDDAIAWIGDQGADSWFLWLAFNAPHTPHQRPPNDLHDYDTISDDGADDSRAHFEAMVQAMDTEMARLLASVDLSVTTVIFIGDNGTIRQVVQPPIPMQHAKSTFYEGGVRVPLLIYGAAVDSGLAGATYDGVLHSCDIYATVLELFGVEARAVVPAELVLDSRSFAPVLRGEAHVRAPAEVVTANAIGASTGTVAVEGDYKYILVDGGTEEFYNVVTDLPEANNLLEGPLTAPEQAAFDSLKAKLESYENMPRIHSYYFDGDGKFNVEVGWFANEGFTLSRSPDLDQWAPLTGQEFEDNGGAALILRDPSPPTSRAFYRVSEP